MAKKKQSLEVIDPAELTTLEACKLENFEKTIELHKGAFVAVGRALAEIRDGRLYREKFATFEAYCESRWTFDKSYAYRLIKGARVVAVVSPIGDVLPDSEAVTRELGKVDELEQPAVWQEALEVAGDDHPTAANVREAVELRRSRDPAETKTCPNCGGRSFDDDGDCESCREPAVVKPERRTRVAPAKDVAGVEKLLADLEAILGRADGLRDKLPMQQASDTVDRIQDAMDAAKRWQRAAAK